MYVMDVGIIQNMYLIKAIGTGALLIKELIDNLNVKKV
jgi:hypothetical protein